VGRAGQELDRLVEDAGGQDAVGELPCGPGDGPEGRVDRAGRDRGDGRVRVEQAGHDLEPQPRLRIVEVTQQAGGGDPRVDHVDAQRAAARPDGVRGPLLGQQEGAGVRQERLPVRGEPGSARRPAEQPHGQVALEPGDALGDGLLGDRQVGGRVLELTRVGGGHESAHGIELHADRP
jgi:hypothetical protein